MGYSWHNFWRNKKVSAAACGVVLALTVFLQVFANSISVNRKELNSAYDAIPVSAFIGGSGGAYAASLNASVYHAVIQSDFVKSYTAMCEVRASADVSLRAISDLGIDPMLADYAAGIQWAEGYDADFCTTDRPVCSVPRWTGTALGEEIALKTGDLFGQRTAFTVVGLYGETVSPFHSKGNVFYYPLPALEAIFQKENREMTYSRLEMELCNLDRLDAFKADMKELGLDHGSAQLVINDVLLTDVTLNLRQQLRMLEGLLPVLMLLSLGIGFGLSFLLLRARKKEAIVMRTLGAKKAFVFQVLIQESLLQAVIGGALGLAISAWIFSFDALIPSYGVLLVAFYVLGGAISIQRLSSVNIFNTMTVSD